MHTIHFPDRFLPLADVTFDTGPLNRCEFLSWVANNVQQTRQAVNWHNDPSLWAKCECVPYLFDLGWIPANAALIRNPC